MKMPSQIRWSLYLYQAHREIVQTFRVQTYDCEPASSAHHVRLHRRRHILERINTILDDLRTRQNVNEVYESSLVKHCNFVGYDMGTVLYVFDGNSATRYKLDNTRIADSRVRYFGNLLLIPHLVTASIIRIRDTEACSSRPRLYSFKLY